MSRQDSEQKGRWGLASQSICSPQRGQRSRCGCLRSAAFTGAIVSAVIENCQHGARRGGLARSQGQRDRRWAPSVHRRWTARGGARRLLAVTFGALVISGFLSAPRSVDGASELGALLDRYRAARDRGAQGDVTGRVYDEPSRRNAPPRALAAAALVLLPLSAEHAAELDALKADARRSMERYRRTAAAVDSFLERYAAAVRSSGGADLIKRGSTDEEGTFRFERVPAGEWLLLARLEAPRQQVQRPRTVPRGPDQQFSGNLEHHGRTTVTYWWRVIDVRAGEAMTLELTDRNATLTAVREELRTPSGSPTPLLRNH
jgi:hypothetical protein